MKTLCLVGTVSLLLLGAAVPFARACIIDAECDDGDVCNGLETCVAGACQSGTALCVPLLGCQHTPVVDGTSCSDGNLCNGSETCLGGVCGGSGGLGCDDNSPCTADTCDPLLGCQHAPVVDGTACSDGDACNGTETCQGGTCTAGTALNCNDNNACTTDTCDAAAGCQHAAVPNGTACGDGNA